MPWSKSITFILCQTTLNFITLVKAGTQHQDTCSRPSDKCEGHQKNNNPARSKQCEGQWCQGHQHYPVVAPSNTQPIPCPVTGGLWVHGINWQGTRWKESCAAPCSRVCRQGQACGSSALVVMCCGRCSACRTRLHTSSSETATMHSAGVSKRRSETNGTFINKS